MAKFTERNCVVYRTNTPDTTGFVLRHNCKTGEPTDYTLEHAYAECMTMKEAERVSDFLMKKNGNHHIFAI